MVNFIIDTNKDNRIQRYVFFCYWKFHEIQFFQLKKFPIQIENWKKYTGGEKSVSTRKKYRTIVHTSDRLVAERPTYRSITPNTKLNKNFPKKVLICLNLRLLLYQVACCWKVTQSTQHTAVNAFVVASLMCSSLVTIWSYRVPRYSRLQHLNESVYYIGIAYWTHPLPNHNSSSEATKQLTSTWWIWLFIVYLIKRRQVDGEISIYIASLI